MIHQVPIKSLPQEWLWCETWCDDASKKRAKTIDLVKLLQYIVWGVGVGACLLLHLGVHQTCQVVIQKTSSWKESSLFFRQTVALFHSSQFKDVPLDIHSEFFFLLISSLLSLSGPQFQWVLPSVSHAAFQIFLSPLVFSFAR